MLPEEAAAVQRKVTAGPSGCGPGIQRSGGATRTAWALPAAAGGRGGADWPVRPCWVRAPAAALGSCQGRAACLGSQSPRGRSLLLASRSGSRRRGAGAGRRGCLWALSPHRVCCSWRVPGRHPACGERGAGQLCARRPQLLPRWCAGAAPAEEEERQGVLSLHAELFRDFPVTDT